MPYTVCGTLYSSSTELYNTLRHLYYISNYSEKSTQLLSFIFSSVYVPALVFRDSIMICDPDRPPHITFLPELPDHCDCRCASPYPAHIYSRSYLLYPYDLLRGHNKMKWPIIYYYNQDKCGSSLLQIYSREQTDSKIRAKQTYVHGVRWARRTWK